MINKYPQVAFIYNRYKKATSTKPASIEIRINYNYKQRYISTGISVLPHQWKRNKVVGIDNAMEINQLLDKMMMNIRKIILDMQHEGTIDITLIPDRLKKMRDNKPSFIDFCRQRAIIRKYGKSKDSQERYNRFLRLFLEWGNIKEFSDITDQMIISYDEYLSSRKLKPYSKWNNYHRFLNSFILDAIAEGLLTRNPYNWVNISRDKGSKSIEKYLTPEEFRRIKNAKMPTLSLERVRDVFVFQTYTCLSYTDLKSFTPSKIENIKGMKVYTGSRDKTSKPFVIPLMPTAIEILHKYNNQLPVISNVKYNEYLKVVAQAAGIDKPVSSHWARHTGATLLLNEGVDLKIVSKICGHSSIKMTEQVYAKLLNDTIVDAISKVKI